MHGFLELLIAALLSIFASAQANQPAERLDVVGLVGDSITAMNQETVSRGLQQCAAPPVTIDAISGRLASSSNSFFGYIPSGKDAVREIEASVDPNTWIIELGVNDVNSGLSTTRESARAIIDSVLDQVDPTDKVYWVNTYTEVGRPGDSAIFNRTLNEYPRITVVDWASIAAPYLYDGLHPTKAGAEQMTEMYCDILN